jgi:hypothetical protein
MSDTQHSTCPHPRESWVKEESNGSYDCHECKARVCLDCHRYGSTGFMIPLVSWMTGTCEDCSRKREQRMRIRDDYYRDRDRRIGKARVWEEGRSAAADATNPYDEPTYSETIALEQNAWLRDEVTA